MHTARFARTTSVRMPSGLRTLSAIAVTAALSSSTTVLAIAQATPATPAATPTPTPAAAPAPAASEAWNGHWTGKVSTAQVTPPGQTPIDMPIYLRVAGTPEAPVVEVTAVLANALAKAARSPRIDGRKMTFLLESAGRPALLEGELSEDGKSVTGSFGFVDADGKAIPPTLPWTMRRTDAVTEVASARTYSGTLEVQAQKIPMKIALGEGAHGWCGAIEIAAQGLRNFPIEVVRTADGFDLTIPLGLPVLVRLTGDASSNTLNGMFMEGPVTVPISFTAEAGAKLAGNRRPQDPVAPFPYTDREVVIDHIFGHKLAGTFTIPNDKSLAVDGKFPVVVLVTGSGAQDRDESLFGHRPFAVIADALARAGVAVLRYDDRGVGGSTGEHSMCTSYDFATDADMATEWLKKQPEIDPRRIGMLGHSEGAMIAPLVAEWQNKGDEPENPLAFVVLLAAPVEPCAAVLNRQTQMLYDAAGVPKERSKPAVDAHERVMRAILDKRPNAEIRPLVAEMVALQLAAAGQSVPDEATFNATIDAAMAEVAGKWMLTFIRHDPRSSIVVNEVPILAMWGSLDTQIDPNSNSSLMTALTLPAGRPATVKVYPGLNHLLQPATTGSPDEYGAIETTIDPAALSDIVAWVVETARKGPLPQIPEATRPGIRVGGAATDENTPAPGVQRPVEPNSQRLLTPAGAAPTGSPK